MVDTVLAKLRVKECAYQNFLSGSLYTPVKLFAYMVSIQRVERALKSVFNPNSIILTPPDSKHILKKKKKKESSFMNRVSFNSLHTSSLHSYTYFLFFYPTCALKKFKEFMEKESANITSLTAASLIY